MKLYFCYKPTDCFFTGSTQLVLNEPPESLNVYAVIDAGYPQQVIDHFMRDVSPEGSSYADRTLSAPIERPVGVVFAIFKSILDAEAFSNIQYSSWCASESDDVVIKTVRTLERQEPTLQLTRMGNVT